MNNRINKIHEKTLRLVYIDEKNCSLDDLLKKDKTVSIHQRILQFHLAALLRRVDYMRERKILGVSHLAVNKLGAWSCVNS